MFDTFYQFDRRFKKKLSEDIPYLKIKTVTSLEELMEKYQESNFDQALTETFMADYISKFNFELVEDNRQDQILKEKIPQLLNDIRKHFKSDKLFYNFCQGVWSPEFYDCQSKSFYSGAYSISDFMGLLTSEYQRSFELSGMFSSEGITFGDYGKVISTIEAKIKFFNNLHKDLIEFIDTRVMEIQNMAADEFQSEIELFNINIKL